MRRAPVLSLLFLALALAAPVGRAGPEILDPVQARAERRARLAETLGKDYALLLGRPLSDIENPRQEGHILYLTGVSEPSAALLLAGSEAAPLVFEGGERPIEAREILFLLGANSRFARFFGLRYLPGRDSADALGIELTRPVPCGGEAMGRMLAEVLPEGARLRAPSYRGSDRADLRERLDRALRKLRKERPDVEHGGLHKELSAMRAVKDEFENHCQAKAIGITEEALRKAVERIRPGSSEAAVESALYETIRMAGARPAYPFVVAAGQNATIPHYFRNEDRIDEGQLLLIDAGASYERYAADITRVFPVSGKFTPRQRELYNVVLRAQLAAIAAVKPGATLSAVDAAARKVITDAGLGDALLHATCHHVGLDVHDPGPSKLEVGMTFTVEPGIYLPREGIGIRIEDIVRVTPGGCVVLTTGLPKRADEVEALLSR